jgi:hypothetical protein
MTAESALEGARARWALMLKRLGEQGIGDRQVLWPFPESAQQAEKYLKETHDYLRKFPETYEKGGIWEEYRSRTDEVLGYYSLISGHKAESAKSTWILIAGIFAALSGTVAAVGGIEQVWKWILSLVRLMFGP